MLFLQLNEWNQVGATYDNTTGVAQLWHNGKMVKSRNIGQIKLATQYPIRIGARDGDDRRFAGKISCLQIYDKALDEQQIGNLKSCPVKGNDCCFSSSKLVLQSYQSCGTGYPLQVDFKVTLNVTFHYKRNCSSVNNNLSRNLPPREIRLLCSVFNVSNFLFLLTLPIVNKLNSITNYFSLITF